MLPDLFDIAGSDAPAGVGRFEDNAYLEVFALDTQHRRDFADIGKLLAAEIPVPTV